MCKEVYNTDNSGTLFDVVCRLMARNMGVGFWESMEGVQALQKRLVPLDTLASDLAGLVETEAVAEVLAPDMNQECEVSYNICTQQ